VSSLDTFELVWPAEEYVSSYTDALRRGWSPDTLRPEAAQEELARIAHNRRAFLSHQIDREAKGPPVILPDGSISKRLPGYRRWMWDGEFCGSIGLRWQRGTTELPPHVLGHIGYSVVPWKRCRGYATRALQLLLPDAKKEGLDYVEITTDTTNVASQKVIEANGGVLIERFKKVHHGGDGLRYRIFFNNQQG
jgi:predicted acetyltransferase